MMLASRTCDSSSRQEAIKARCSTLGALLSPEAESRLLLAERATWAVRMAPWAMGTRDAKELMVLEEPENAEGRRSGCRCM